MMQMLNQQFKSIYSGDSIGLGSSAFLHFHFQAQGLSSAEDAQFIPSEDSFLRSHELRFYTLWATESVQSALQWEERAFINEAVSADISITVPTIHSASDSISFFELGDDAVRNADMRFSVDVPIEMAPADFNLDIDADRAAVFYTTVIGMEFPLDNMYQSADSMPPDLRRSRERLNAGRMICLQKQQLNL